MRKKKYVYVLEIMMVFLLVACGRSNDSSALTPSSDQVANITPAEEEAAPESSLYEGIEEEAVLEPTLDEVIEEVLYYVESEGMVGDADTINTVITVIYEGGYYDPFGIFNILCDEGYILSAPVVPNGIVVLSYTPSEKRTWNGTIYTSTFFTVNLDCIDPNTGAVQHLRTFSSDETHSCSMAFNGLGVNAVLTRMHFNSDFTQMTATLTLEDGSVHVGWIDERGNFTDISKKVMADAGDFGALTNHSNPCFGPGEYFYFIDSTNSNVQVKRVPLNNLTESAVEIMIDNARYNGICLEPYPDGTIADNHSNWDSYISWYYYDVDMTYPALGRYFRDWLSQSECIGLDDNILYKYSLSGVDSTYEWYSDKTALIPEIKGRENLYPVSSPDASKVAFLSKLTTGTDTSPYLYIVPVDGGDPVKVSTNYKFDDTVIFHDIKNAFYSTCLIAWE